jgi:predicted GNAT family acetyltransferase
MSEKPAVEVRNNPEESRYDAFLDGELAGVAVYVLQGEESIIFTHTEVDDRFEGKGIGSALARFALDDVRRDGTRKVVPRCPFIRGWIEKHPDYADLVRD